MESESAEKLPPGLRAPGELTMWRRVRPRLESILNGLIQFVGGMFT